MIDLLTRLAQVRASGDGWTARCPAHDDQHSSLSINKGDDERWLVHCHAGCTFKKVVAALGLKTKDLGPPTPTRRAGGRMRIVATYPYRDEQGTLLYSMCRFEPKDFRPKRADGKWTVKDTRLVPYRLNELRDHRLVCIPEGEKDVDCLWDLGLAATTNPFGAGKWRDDYTQQLCDAGVEHVVILPDNDDAGRAHADQVAVSCGAAGLPVQIVTLLDVPEKGDVSDWLKAGHSRHELDALITAAPAWTPTNGCASHEPVHVDQRRTLAELEEAFGTWICDKDLVPLRAVLAAYVANRHFEGDPVWLLIVGGSGRGKTETITPLATMPDVILVSSITGPAALLSGTATKDRGKDATGGMLRRVPAGGGVLVLKDFTSIIDMHRDARAEVLAAFREIYDGRWDRSIGADGGRTLTWTGRLGVIAGCTTAIDAAHAVVSTMGTRFLMVRLHDHDDLARSAFDHTGDEVRMREELRGAVRGLLNHLPGCQHNKAPVREPMLALANHVALARSPVDRDQRSEIRLVLDAEAPTRIVKMLTQLWRAAGCLGLDPKASWQMVLRVGLDSIPKLRRSVLDSLESRSVPASTTEIAEAIEHPTQTTRRALEDLTAHRVTVRFPGGQGGTDRWALSSRTRGWLDCCRTFPVLSGTTESQTPGNAPLSVSHEMKNLRTDKAGKVPPNKADPELDAASSAELRPAACREHL
jgi:hypothetical protein